MPTRRAFLVTAACGLGSVGPVAWSPAALAGGGGSSPSGAENSGPVIASTWNFGLQANAAAWPGLASGGAALEGVETAARVPEADPAIHSVGLGGYPDRDGRVSLDACIMDHRGRAGAVACLSDIVHAVSVARRVMTETPHVMLAGEGAHAFARQQGFPRQELLTPEMETAWRAWLQKSKYEPRANWERLEEGSAKDGAKDGATDDERPADGHDTIGVLARDTAGNLAGACTTSGAPYKIHGRIGDSPIIGAALFVDNEVGAACATGLGELVMKTCGSFLVVELMRQGLTPEAACRAAVERIVAGNGEIGDLQVGYLALASDGRVGSYAIQPGFQIAVHDSRRNRLSDAPSWI